MTREQIIAALKAQVAYMKAESRMQKDEGNNVMATDLMVDARYVEAAIANLSRINSWITIVK